MVQWAEFLSLLVAEVLRNFSGIRAPETAKIQPLSLSRKTWVRALLGACSRLGWVNDNVDKTRRDIDNAIRLLRIQNHGLAMTLNLLFLVSFIFY